MSNTQPAPLLPSIVGPLCRTCTCNPCGCEGAAGKRVRWMQKLIGRCPASVTRYFSALTETKPTADQLVPTVVELMNEAALAAEADAGFDGGEFSSSAHDELLEKTLTVLAEANGFTFDELMAAEADAVGRCLDAETGAVVEMKAVSL